MSTRRDLLFRPSSRELLSSPDEHVRCWLVQIVPPAGSTRDPGLVNDGLLNLGQSEVIDGGGAKMCAEEMNVVAYRDRAAIATIEMSMPLSRKY